MGRPSKLNAETQKAIVDALAFGCTRRDAALAAGVTYDAFNDWMNAGAVAKRGIFLQFFHAVTRAEAEARKKYTGTIAQAAAAGDWRAAESFLKRRDPENWGDKQEDKHSGEVSITVTYRDQSTAPASGADDDQA